MPRLPKPGSDTNVWGAVLNEYLSVEHNSDGTLKSATTIKSAEQTANKGRPNGYAGLDASGVIPTTQLPALSKSTIGLQNVDNTSDDDKPISTAVQTALAEKMPLTGGTLAGDLTIGSGGAVRRLFLPSSNSGGENNSDSTSRVTLQSYQRWQKKASDGVTEAHFGELVRMQMMTNRAKAVIAWQDAWTDPTKPYTVAGIVGHYLPNDISDPVHGHVSIEVVDSNKLVQTRFEVRYTDEDGNIGVDQCLIKTSDARFVVDASNGGSYIAGDGSVYKNFYFSNNTHGLAAGNRWALQQDITLESGGNIGSDFRINRHNDSGVFQETALFIRRSNGQIGVGGITNPSAKLDITTPGSYHTVQSTQTTTGSSVYATYAAQLGNANNKYLDFKISGDAASRVTMLGDGKIEWGSGLTARDTNLYRAAADTLKTDDNFEVAGTLTVAGNVVQTILATKSVDQSLFDTATLVNDPDLSASVVANGIYEVTLFAIYDASSTGDMKIGFSAPAGSTFDYVTGSLDAAAGSATTGVKMSWQNLAGTPSVGGIGVGSKAILRLTGILNVGASDGALQWRWSQMTAEATNLTVYKNSYMRLVRMR